jgi:hypothetical protein
MNAIKIYADNSISVGTKVTGYAVKQEQEGTKVYKHANNGEAITGPDVLGLPKQRYTLSTADGKAEFERDFLAAYNAI